MRSVKETCRSLLIMLIAVIVGLVVLELSMRAYLAFVPPPDDSPYIPDPHAIYRMRPTHPDSIREGEMSINSFGFRDREHPTVKNEGSFRMLGIGDSFVWGAVPLEENFLCIAEKSLRTGWTDPEMILLGLGGYSPENYVGILRSLGLSLDPDLVILNLFVGNDIHMTEVRGELLRGRRYFTGSSNPVLNILRKSRVFVMSEMLFLRRIKAIILGRRYRKAYEMVKAQPESGSETGTYDGTEPYVINEMYVHIQNKRLRLFLREPDRHIESLWRRTERDILEFDRLCREAGVPWMIFIVPTEIQVDTETRRKVLEMLVLDPDQYDFDLPQDRLREFAGEQGITILDPLARMRSLHADDDRLYLPNNTHWNTRGNAVAGRVLADFIEDNYSIEKQ